MLADVDAFQHFENQESEFFQILSRGLERAKSKHGIGWLNALHPVPIPKNHSSLWAMEKANRMKLFRAACSTMLHHFNVSDPTSYIAPSIMFVTLIPKQFVTSTEPDNVPLHALRMWVTQCMMGFNFIGMIEPALFSSMPNAKARKGTQEQESKKAISWHVHLLVWSREPLASFGKVVKARCKGLNARFKTMFWNKEVARANQLQSTSIGNFVSTLAYIFKSPINEYQAGHIKPKTSGRDQKGRKKRGHPPVRVNKQHISGCNAVLLYRIMSEMRLDDLLVGGGEGATIRNVTRDVASSRGLHVTSSSIASIF